MPVFLYSLAWVGAYLNNVSVCMHVFIVYMQINSALDPNSNDPVVLLLRAVCSGFAERRSWQLAAYECKRDCSAFVQSKDRARHDACECQGSGGRGLWKER